MPRPKKCRLIGEKPTILYFKPRGIPARELEEVELTLDELEAIKLKDLMGLDQEECARRMNISRPTFHRILVSARKKIAEFLIYGKILKVDERVKLLNARRFRCRRCAHEFKVPQGERIREYSCPKCNSHDFESLHKIVWR